MVCADIGEPNADIAGIGVVAAFVIQSAIAFILSLLLDLILVDPHGQPSILYRQGSPESRETVDVQDHVSVLDPDDEHSTQSVSNPPAVFRILQDDSQRRHLLLNSRERSPRAVFVRLEVRKIIAEILWTASDAQTLAGIALAITGIAQRQKLSLYQFHLIYDTINFTSITNCAALSAASVVEVSDLFVRLASIMLFAVLYLVFTVLFGVRLSQWDDTRPGFCYNTDGLAATGAAHPLVDNVYIAITCFYMYAILFLSCSQAISKTTSDDPIWRNLRDAVPSDFFVSKPSFSWSNLWHGTRGKKPKSSKVLPSDSGVKILKKMVHAMSVLNYRLSNPVLAAALLQLPLHFYFIIRLRMSNEPLLQDGNEENDWGFGQVFALVMSVGLIVECCKGIDGRTIQEPEDTAYEI